MRATGTAARLLAGIALAVLASACGGGGGGGNDDGGVVGPQTASFAAADPTPPADSVSLQQASRAGLVVDVRVAATDVDDFFGAGFRLNYDPAVVRFESSDTSTSFLRDPPFNVPGAGLQFLVDTTTPGSLAVVATRQQNQTGTATGVDVTGTRTLLTLRFRLLVASTGSPATLPPAEREVRDSQDNALALTWHGGAFFAN